MPEHVFTADHPHLLVPVTPPSGATALLVKFTLKPPANTGHPTVPIRFLHCRLAGHAGQPPKASEIFELKLSANGMLVVELSGFGNKRPEFREPLKLDMPEDGKVSVRLGVAGLLNVNGHDGQTHLGITGPLELVFGMEKSFPDLAAPLGWTLSWSDDAISWESVSGSPAPTPLPSAPATPSAPAQTPPAPPAAVTPPPATLHPDADANAELKKDLEALALKYAVAKGIDPMILMVLQLAIAKIGKG